MSNVIPPMVSTTPPPLADSQDYDDDDEFGEFTTADYEDPDINGTESAEENKCTSNNTNKIEDEILIKSDNTSQNSTNTDSGICNSENEWTVPNKCDQLNQQLSCVTTTTTVPNGFTNFSSETTKHNNNNNNKENLLYNNNIISTSDNQEEQQHTNTNNINTETIILSKDNNSVEILDVTQSSINDEFKNESSNLFSLNKDDSNESEELTNEFGNFENAISDSVLESKDLEEIKTEFIKNSIDNIVSECMDGLKSNNESTENIKYGEDKIDGNVLDIVDKEEDNNIFENSMINSHEEVTNESKVDGDLIKNNDDTEETFGKTNLIREDINEFENVINDLSEEKYEQDIITTDNISDDLQIDTDTSKNDNIEKFENAFNDTSEDKDEQSIITPNNMSDDLQLNTDTSKNDNIDEFENAFNDTSEDKDEQSIITPNNMSDDLQLNTDTVTSNTEEFGNFATFNEKFETEQDDFGDFEDFQNSTTTNDEFNFEAFKSNTDDDNFTNTENDNDNWASEVSLPTSKSFETNIDEDDFDDFESADASSVSSPQLQLCDLNKMVNELFVFNESVISEEDIKDEKLTTILARSNLWNSIKDIHSSPALSFQWGISATHDHLLNALKIDVRNIMHGQRLNMPRFAANLGNLPLEPTKAELNSQTSGQLCGSSNSILNISSFTSQSPQQEHVPAAQFDWTGSGLINPLDSPIQPTVDTNTNQQIKQKIEEKNISQTARSIILSIPNLSYMTSNNMIYKHKYSS